MNRRLNRLPRILVAKQAPAILTRRGFLAGAAGLAGAAVWQGGSSQAWGQRQPDTIHDISGTVRVNGERINSRAVIKAGDLVTTGPDGKIGRAHV